MAVRMRLRRTGKKKQAYYRVVVTDSRSPRDGRFIESVGNYDPHANPAVVNIDEERALHWLKNGALPSDTVRSLLSKQGVLSKLAAEAPGHAVLKKPVVRRSKKSRAAEEKAAADKKAVAEAEAKAAAEAAKKAAEEAAATAQAEAEAAAAAEEPAAEEEAAPEKEAGEEADA